MEESELDCCEIKLLLIEWKLPEGCPVIIADRESKQIMANLRTKRFLP